MTKTHRRTLKYLTCILDISKSHTFSSWKSWTHQIERRQYVPSPTPSASPKVIPINSVAQSHLPFLFLYSEGQIYPPRVSYFHKKNTTHLCTDQKSGVTLALAIFSVPRNQSFRCQHLNTLQLVSPFPFPFPLHSSGHIIIQLDYCNKSPTASLPPISSH